MHRSPKHLFSKSGNFWYSLTNFGKFRSQKFGCGDNSYKYTPECICEGCLHTGSSKTVLQRVPRQIPNAIIRLIDRAETGTEPLDLKLLWKPNFRRISNMKVQAMVTLSWSSPTGSNVNPTADIKPRVPGQDSAAHANSTLELAGRVQHKVYQPKALDDSESVQ